MAKRSFKQFVEQELGKFPEFFIYAVLEWVLIFALFIHGFIAFLAKEYAKFFELGTPCVLCTRIDHLFVRRNHDSYYHDSICEFHEKDISSLAYCHVHQRLSDIRKMCETCLLSFATEKDADCEVYKSVVGILHKDVELFVDPDREGHLTMPGRRKDDVLHSGKSNVNCCQCCGEPLRAKSYYGKGKHVSLSHAPAPSPRAPLMNMRPEDFRNMDLPHIRFSDLKPTSENESLPEDEDGSNAMNFEKLLRVPEGEYFSEDKTPPFARGNRFFGIPLTDSAAASPRWSTRLPRKSPLEKTESASDSTEGQANHEADGESIFYHLKRQVRLDHKSLIELYMELDEERSASAIAANNAMAMITRLQAEKAAVQMEALQYQRMMEEQAEYDQEALQATNHMLNKREQVIKVMQAELEAYREKYGCLNEFEECSDEAGENYQDLKSESFVYGKYDSYSSSEGENNENDKNDRLRMEVQNGGRILDTSHNGGKSRRSRGLKSKDKKIQVASDDERSSLHSSGDDAPNTLEDIEQKGKAILTRELSHLHERVKALETDDGFVTSSCETLQKNVSEGTQILTDIAENLAKLRNIVSRPFDDNDARVSS